MSRIELPEGYKPTKREKYMNPKQREYFRLKLLAWRQSLLNQSQQTIDEMRAIARDVSDEAERASREAQVGFDLRTQDRYRQLLAKINDALRRIDDETYGFCDETGDPIGLARLEARPIATLSVEAQERREQMGRQYGSRA